MRGIKGDRGRADLTPQIGRLRLEPRQRSQHLPVSLAPGQGRWDQSPVGVDPVGPLTRTNGRRADPARSTGQRGRSKCAKPTSRMVLLLLYVSLALGVSFMCSLIEAVLLSVTPTFVASMEKEKPGAAARLGRLKENIDRPLAAILSLNTIAHTVGAAGAGAQAAVVFGSAAVGVASAVLTLLILVVSELIPKTLGAVHWRRMALPVARVVEALVVVTYPFVLLAQGIHKVLTPAGASDHISRAEVAAMAELGAEQGVLDETESKIVANLLRLRSLSATDIMTPRTVVFALAESETVGSVVDDPRASPFSRVPLYRVTGRSSFDSLSVKKRA